MVLICKILSLLLLWMVWLKLIKWFWRRGFLNNINVFSLFYYYLPLQIYVALHLNKLEFLSPKDTLCQVCLKLILWFFFTLFYPYILSSPPVKGRCLQGMPTFIKNVFKVCQLVKFNRCLYSKRLCLFSNLLINTR